MNAGCSGDVAERRRAERVAVGGVAGDLLAAEVLVRARAVERDVVHRRGNDLRDPDRRARWKSLNISFERPGDGVAPRRSRPCRRTAARRASLRSVERVPLAARVPVDRRVRERQRELELRDRAREHLERDRRRRGAPRERPRRTASGRRATAFEPAHHLGADGVVVAREREARDLGALGRRDERLGDEQVRLIRERLALRVPGRESPRCCRTGRPRATRSGRSTSGREERGVDAPSARAACSAARRGPGRRRRCCRSRSRSAACRRSRSSASGSRRSVLSPFSAGDRVEPEQPAGVGEPRVERPAEPRRQRRLDVAREAELLQTGCEGIVPPAARRPGARPTGPRSLRPRSRLTKIAPGGTTPSSAVPPGSHVKTLRSLERVADAVCRCSPR